MLYKVAFGFSGKGVGWQETHAVLSSLNEPKLLAPTMIDIAQKRVPMLGREFTLVGIRISRYANDAGVKQRGVYPIKQDFSNPVQTQSAASEPGDVALLTVGTAVQSQVFPQFNSNTNRSFLGAPLDVSVTNGGVVLQGNGGLGAAFGTWRSAVLAANMGWLASVTILDVALDVISQNTDGTVQMTTTANLLPTAVQGAKYRARIRGVNNRHSALNGEVVLSVDDTHTMTTVNIIGIPTAQSGGNIRIYQAVSPFVAYGDITLEGTVGNHKRGRPFGSRPGRRPARIRG